MGICSTAMNWIFDITTFVVMILFNQKGIYCEHHYHPFYVNDAWIDKMKFQLKITHLLSYKTSTSPIQEVTQSELDEFKRSVMDGLERVTYLELGNDIWPGDVIRSSCVISFIVEQ